MEACSDPSGLKAQMPAEAFVRQPILALLSALLTLLVLSYLHHKASRLREVLPSHSSATDAMLSLLHVYEISIDYTELSLVQSSTSVKIFPAVLGLDQYSNSTQHYGSSLTSRRPAKLADTGVSFRMTIPLVQIESLK